MNAGRAGADSAALVVPHRMAIRLCSLFHVSSKICTQSDTATMKILGGWWEGRGESGGQR